MSEDWKASLREEYRDRALTAWERIKEATDHWPTNPWDPEGWRQDVNHSIQMTIRKAFLKGTPAESLEFMAQRLESYARTAEEENRERYGQEND